MSFMEINGETLDAETAKVRGEWKIS